MKRLVIATTGAVIAFAALPANAYVDPGTGSMAVQMIIGGLVAAAFMIKTYYYKIKRRIARLFGRDSGYKADLDPETVALNSADESTTIDK